MATIRAYTTIEQSKKLADILPIESADMKWYFWKSEIDAPKIPTFGYSKTAAETCKNTEAVYLPCWSLAALISILPNEIKHDGIVNNLWITSEDVSYYSKEDSYLYCEEGCTIDACYKMIIKLSELKML